VAKGDDKIAFMKLTISGLYAIATYVREAPGSGSLDFYTQEQREAAAKQRVFSLFFRSPDRRRPRIYAEHAMSAAVNLPQKQQEQRDPPVLDVRLVARTLQ
jgi:hypothetical protein